MSNSPTQPPPTQSPVQVDWTAVLSFLWSIFPSGLIKTMLGFILGGATAGYVVSYQVNQTIQGMPKGILPKIFGPKQKAEDAITRIRFGNAGCTATIMAPVRDEDETIDILTAAHCVTVGAKGKMYLKDGRELDVVCVTRNAAADVAWLRAARPPGFVPSLSLADDVPPVGTRVWHQGYGIDAPGNREDGTVVTVSADRLKVQFSLSVSPGDSGGGIVTDDDSRVVSPVCCTTAFAKRADVWGGTPAAAAAIRPLRTSASVSDSAKLPILDLAGRSWGSPWN